MSQRLINGYHYKCLLTTKILSQYFDMLYQIVGILILLAACQSADVDYHLEKTIALSNSGKVGSVTSLGNKGIAFVSGDLPNCNISILGGQNYENQYFESFETDLVSKPRFTSSDIMILNKGFFLFAKNFNKSTYIYNLNISGTILGTQQRTFIPQARQCPTLSIYNELRNQIETKTLSTDQFDCNYYSDGHISLVNNKYILFAGKFKFFMLNSYNYQVVDDYTEGVQRNEQIYHSIDSFYQPSLDSQQFGQLTAVMMRGTSKNYRVIKKDSQTGGFKNQYVLYNPTQSLYVTGVDQAVSLYRTTLYRWQTLKPSNLAAEYVNQGQLLPGSPLCVSVDETLIVQNDNGKIVIFNIDQKLIISKKGEFVTGFSLIFQGRIDKTNKYLLFNAEMDANKLGTTFCRLTLQTNDFICIKTPVSRSVQSLGLKKLEYHTKLKVNSKGYLGVDFKSKTLPFFTEEQICKEWTIFSQSQRFVGLCLNTNSLMYELRLYSYETMQLLLSQQIYIGDLGLPFNVKLIKNQYKEQGDPSVSDRALFFLSFKRAQDESSDQAWTIRYIVERTLQGYGFIRQNSPFPDISYRNVFAYGPYIASLKLKNSTYRQNLLKFYNVTTFKLIDELAFENSAEPGKYDFFAYRNVFMLKTTQNFKQTRIFDLKKKVGQAGFYRGAQFIEYFNKNSFIFPQKNMLYTYRIENQPIKYIIDISSGLIKSISSTKPAEAQKDETVQMSKYLKPDVSVVGRLCEIIFTISNNQWLDRYQQCQQTKITNRYPLTKALTGTLVVNDLYETSSKQGIIIKYTHTLLNKKCNILEIRNIEDPRIILWKQNKTAQAQNLNFANYIETYYGTSVIKFYKTQAVLQMIDNVVNASYFQLISFNDVESIDDQHLAYIGQNQASGGKDSYLFYRISSQTTEEREEEEEEDIIQIVEGESGLKGVTGLVIIKDQFCPQIVASPKWTHLATFTTKGKILAWDITASSPAIKLNITRPGVESVQFIGENKIGIYKGLDQFQIVVIPVKDDFQFTQTFLTASNSLIAVTKDGTTYASASSLETVDIISSSQQKIRTFKLPAPGQQIVSLSFSEDNSLIVTSNTSNLYILSPTPCPNPFINTNGVCTCRNNQVQKDNICQCRNRYTKTDEVCVCDKNQFIQEDGQCICSSNATEVEGECKCLQNFVKKGAQCICLNSFQFDTSKLVCSCLNGIVDNQECVSCSFPCGTCSGSVSSCSSYSALFYVLIIVSILAIIAIIGAAVFVIKKKKNKSAHSELLKEQIEKI